MSHAHCPRCDVPLSEGLGVLHEDVCGACQGRFVHPENAQRVLTDELGHDPAFLRELSKHFAGEPIDCPGCASTMSAITLRGAPLELCQGCGGMWLDKGELSRLTTDRYREVEADPPAPPPAPDDESVEIPVFEVPAKAPEPSPFESLTLLAIGGLVFTLAGAVAVSVSTQADRADRRETYVQTHRAPGPLGEHYTLSLFAKNQGGYNRDHNGHFADLIIDITGDRFTGTLRVTNTAPLHWRAGTHDVGGKVTENQLTFDQGGPADLDTLFIRRHESTGLLKSFGELEEFYAVPMVPILDERMERRRYR